MAKRWFTSDFHLGFSKLLEIEKWPFKTIEKHDNALLISCRQRASAEDTIVHVGDLASYGMDRHQGLDSKGLDVSPMRLIKDIPANFVNIRGNHDNSNKVKSVADSMQTHLGKRFPQVTVGHYPSYDRRSEGYVRSGWINVCGHVHSAWKHCLDLDRKILNINAGCMVWNFKIVSEDELIQYINRVLSHRPDEIFRCKSVGGKTVFFGDKRLCEKKKEKQR
jgi:calcineurin-like phosphoesterase family protein